MISYSDDHRCFHLQTRTTSYILAISDQGHPLHLYYGARIETGTDPAYLFRQIEGVGWKGTPRASSTAYSEKDTQYSLHYLPLEFGSHGKGDYRTPSLRIPDGPGRVDMVYSGHEILQGPFLHPGLPSIRGSEKNTETLLLHLTDNFLSLDVTLIYQVIPEADCLIRSLRIRNSSEVSRKITEVRSFVLDIPNRNYSFLSLHGSWIREREIEKQKIGKCHLSAESRFGVSSSVASPFYALLEEGAAEDRGEVLGVAFLYSGNHQSGVCPTNHNYLRLYQGLHPGEFDWTLDADEDFFSPMTALSYSGRGLSGMSRNFHKLVNEHIIPPFWREKERPVLLNSWEANYFDFKESTLLKQARLAKELGIELFVLDDGWFGKRDDDTSSLGDWTVYKKKIPGGIDGLSRKINKLGLSFGLWFEPEMINKDSELFRSHPEYVLGHPDAETSPGRNQYLLDLTRPEVRDYLYEAISVLIREADINYIKWDMNRNFSDLYSSNLPEERQGELSHRLVLGLYDLLKKLTEAFPQVLFESCASGGNRFDLGMLYFMPQTWTSDNTDAVQRLSIQYGTSLFAPLSAMGAHVSGKPNHQVLRNTPLESRFNTAAFGVLGYELDPTQLTAVEKKIVQNQIAFYKKHRRLFQFGSFYRIKDGRNICTPPGFQGDDDQQIVLWLVMDRQTALLGYYQKTARPNPDKEFYPLSCFDKKSLYSISARSQSMDIRDFGDLIKEVSPVNMKINGVLHTVAANHVPYELGKSEWESVPGVFLSKPGFSPKQQFYGTGISEDIEIVGDFGSRIIIFERVEP